MLTFKTVAAIAVACLFTSAGNAQEDRGKYLAQIMDCGGCHTPGYLVGKPDMERYLGGSEVGFEVPGLGMFYPPNLTNHETGLAAWSEEEIVTAIRTGARPDGRQLAPIMPYMHYSILTDEDAHALVRFLKETPAVDNKVPDPVPPGAKASQPYMTVQMPE